MLSLTTSRVITDYFSIKEYTEDYYRLTFHHYPVKNSGYEEEVESYIFNEKLENELKEPIDYDFRLDNSIVRSRSKIFEYAICNKFDYFITFTLDKLKKDRNDIKSFIKDLGQLIRNRRRKYNIDIQYILIPEQHKDGAWHMHGLVKGVPQEELKLFTLKDKLPGRLRKLITLGHQIYNWVDYSEQFGFCTVEKIKNQEACSKYITKYISKDLGEGLKKGDKLYYNSRGLKIAEKKHSGQLSGALLKKLSFDFVNDYVSILTLNRKEYNDILQYI